jgi:hypothetical protein
MAKQVRVGRPYCEAFMGLDILQAESRWLKGFLVCQWRNEEGLAVGNVELSDFDDDRVSFYWRSFGTVNNPRHEGWESILIQRRECQIVGGRPVGVCRECNHGVTKVYCVDGSWKCRGCHKLTYRSTRLSNDSRKQEELRRLVDELRDGRPRYMRRKEHERLMARRAQLERELKGCDVAAPHRELRFKLTPEWLGRGDPRIERAAEPGSRGWSEKEGNGFSRLQAIDLADKWRYQGRISEAEEFAKRKAGLSFDVFNQLKKPDDLS